jgi:hypothetical protein
VSGIEYTLPSGRKVTLRIPLGADIEAVQAQLLEQTKGDPNGAMRVLLERDSLMPRVALQGDSGSAGGGLDPDPRHRFDQWDALDIQSYELFYDELTKLTREESDAVKAAAKSARAGLRGK